MIEVDRNDFSITAAGYMLVAFSMAISGFYFLNKMCGWNYCNVNPVSMPIIGVVLIALGLFALYKANILDGLVFILVGIMEGTSWYYSGTTYPDLMIYALILIVLIAAAYRYGDYILLALLTCICIAALVLFFDKGNTSAIYLLLYAAASVLSIIVALEEWDTVIDIEDQYIESLMEEPEDKTE